MIELRNIHFGYKGRPDILNGVDLAVPSGRIHTLVGPNGAGKSTLFSIACGDRSPRKGSVLLGERDVRDIGLNMRARLRAVMPQHTRIAFPFSVRETVLLGRTPYSGGRYTERDRIMCERALHLLGLEHLAGQQVATLSGGERQRVELARALVQVDLAEGSGTRYLLLDEPTASLDIFSRHDILALLRKPPMNKLGILLILHDINLAARYADHISVLGKCGTMIATGTPAAVLNEDVIYKAFNVRVHIAKHPEWQSPLVIV